MEDARKILHEAIRKIAEGLQTPEELADALALVEELPQVLGEALGQTVSLEEDGLKYSVADVPGGLPSLATRADLGTTDALWILQSAIDNITSYSNYEDPDPTFLADAINTLAELAKNGRIDEKGFEILGLSKNSDAKYSQEHLDAITEALAEEVLPEEVLEFLVGRVESSYEWTQLVRNPGMRDQLLVQMDQVTTQHGYYSGDRRHLWTEILSHPVFGKSQFWQDRARELPTDLIANIAIDSLRDERDMFAWSLDELLDLALKNPSTLSTFASYLVLIPLEKIERLSQASKARLMASRDKSVREYMIKVLGNQHIAAKAQGRNLG